MVRRMSTLTLSGQTFQIVDKKKIWLSRTLLKPITPDYSLEKKATDVAQYLTDNDEKVKMVIKATFEIVPQRTAFTLKKTPNIWNVRPLCDIDKNKFLCNIKDN